MFTFIQPRGICLRELTCDETQVAKPLDELYTSEFTKCPYLSILIGEWFVPTFELQFFSFASKVVIMGCIRGFFIILRWLCVQTVNIKLGKPAFLSFLPPNDVSCSCSGSQITPITPPGVKEVFSPLSGCSSVLS